MIYSNSALKTAKDIRLIKKLSKALPEQPSAIDE